MSKLINDLICRGLQKIIYTKVYKGHQPNEWKPWKEPDTIQTENGMVLHNDVCYGKNYPNS